MDKDANILIVGHGDIIDQSLYAYFQKNGFDHVFSSSAIALNTTIQASVYDFFQRHRPEYVYLTSVRSGGIEANRKNGAEFIYQNLESQNNVVYAAWKFGVKKLLFCASSCVYPKESPQPIKESALLTGPLEATSEPYSVAKIAGIKLCQAFHRQYGLNTAIMVPATVYGAGSDMDLETAHVIGALIGKFSDAAKKGEKQVTVWGSGHPRREFLYADDFVDACRLIMDQIEGEEVVNVGPGEDVSIKELAEIIAGITGFKGKVIFDASKPEGTMKKQLDNSRIKAMGWRPQISLEEGIGRTYQWYRENEIRSSRI